MEKIVKIVSYNTQLSLRIKRAIKIFQTHKQLADANIICLQEMTQKGVQEFAEALNYDYVYFPSGGHWSHNRILGNAVLTKYPIVDAKEWVFNHPQKNARRRTAVGAQLDIGQRKLDVYSVHKEVVLKPDLRQLQIQELIESALQNKNPCVIAGDFNTFRQNVIQKVVQTFNQKGFKLATASIGWTHKTILFLNRTNNLDHIFVRGLEIKNAGVVFDRRASDHMPIWADFSVESQNE